MATYWVDDNAAANGDGSFDTPFDTIGEAISAGAAGDTVFVYPGTYSEAVNVSVAQMVLCSIYGASSVTINPSGASNALNVSGAGATARGFTIDGASLNAGVDAVVYSGLHVTLEDLIVTNSVDFGIVGAASSASMYAKLRRIVIEDNASNLGIFAQSDRNLIEDCFFESTAFGGVRIGSSYNVVRNCYHPNAEGGGDSFTITAGTYNVFDNCHGGGVYGFDVQTDNNRIVNCTGTVALRSGISGNYIHNHGGLITDEGGTSSNIYNNEQCSASGESLAALRARHMIEALNR